MFVSIASTSPGIRAEALHSIEKSSLAHTLLNKFYDNVELSYKINRCSVCCVIRSIQTTSRLRD